MKNSLDMEFQEWEFISNTTNESDTNNFSNILDSKKEEDEVLDLECKDIQVFPQSPTINLLSDDRFMDTNIKELEEDDQEHDQEHEEEYDYYKDEIGLVKEIEYVNSEAKEKQAFWMVGALCSIAAATVCIFIFAGKNNQQRKTDHQKIQVQLYTDEKRIKEVMKQATTMNHALSAVRGATTMTRARISFGGYYDGI